MLRLNQRELEYWNLDELRYSRCQSSVMVLEMVDSQGNCAERNFKLEIEMSIFAKTAV